VAAGGVPIGPVMGELHDHAEAARAFEQLVDVGNRVIGRADASGRATPSLRPGTGARFSS